MRVRVKELADRPLDASRDSLNDAVGPNLAEAIKGVRENKVKVIPGYDRVYRRIELLASNTDKPDEQTLSKTVLEQFT